MFNYFLLFYASEKWQLFDFFEGSMKNCTKMVKEFASPGEFKIFKGLHCIKENGKFNYDLNCKYKKLTIERKEED